jgi:hypothetical protein
MSVDWGKRTSRLCASSRFFFAPLVAPIPDDRDDGDENQCLDVTHATWRFASVPHDGRSQCVVVGAARQEWNLLGKSPVVVRSVGKPRGNYVRRDAWLKTISGP